MKELNQYNSRISCDDIPNYPVTPDKLPDWFKKGCRANLFLEDKESLCVHLNGCRQDVYSALSLYQIHVRSIITIMLTLLTALTAILSFASGSTQPSFDLRVVEVVGGTVLIVVFVFAAVSHFILEKYYEVYVSALLFATQTHYWAGLGAFWWYERVIEDLRNRKDVEKERYICERTWSRRDTYVLYVLVVWMLGIVGLLGGLFLLFFKPISG